MKHFIPLALFVVVGCGRGPVAEVTGKVETPETTVVAPAVSDGFTSVADLVKWKDDPSSFKGKTIKVRAKYINPFPELSDRHISDNKSLAPFEKYVEYNGKKIRLAFSVILTAIEKLPNAYPGEEFDIEFEVTSDKWSVGNKAKSISR